MNRRAFLAMPSLALPGAYVGGARRQETLVVYPDGDMFRAAGGSAAARLRSDPRPRKWSNGHWTKPGRRAVGG